MPKRVRAKFASGEFDAVEVPVREATERWTEIALEDGTVLRLKPVVVDVLRAEKGYDQEGNPLYLVKVNQVMSVNAPEDLRRGAPDASTEVH